MSIRNTERSTTQVDDVIAEYLLALESGGPVNQSERINRYPDVRSELERFFESEAELERLAGPLRSVFDSS
jgi:hypothetical protein